MTAYQQGYHAFFEGKDRTACPFTDAWRSDAWMRGWTKALYESEDKRLKEGNIANDQ